MSEHEKFDEFEDSRDLLDDPAQLRQRLLDKGYLFFRGFMDQQTMLDLRKEILESAVKYGYAKPGDDLMEGLFAGGEYPTGLKFATSPLFKEIFHSERFNALPQNESLIQLFTQLLEGEIVNHRRRLCRVTFPQSFTETTPAHQDYHYIQGTQETFTVWMSCGDCPPELGGLAVLEGSHKAGKIEHVPINRLVGIPDDKLNIPGTRWRSTHFKTGDVLLFHSLTVHKALDNRTTDRLRISMDFRYQRKKDAIEPASMENHWSTLEALAEQK